MLMPPLCVTCDAPVMQAHRHCAACWSNLPALSSTLCNSCGIALPLDRQADAICLGCLQAPPDFDRARAPFFYDGLARQTAIAFKNGAEDLAELMAGSMLRAGADLLAPEQIIVPVPLHRWRLFARGYNQSVLLARAIARACEARLELELLQRNRATPRSKGLTKKGRQRNVRGAFQVAPNARSKLAGAHVLLIDDVMTSGATASACARALKRAGVAQVDVLVYARVAIANASTYRTNIASGDDHENGTH